MKRRSVLLFIGSGLAYMTTGNVNALASGYDATVQEMVENAVSLIEKKGLKDAITHSPSGTWVKSDSGLYIFVMGTTGTLYLHPQEQVIGANIRRTRDVDGSPFIEHILQALVRSGDSIWSEYYWADPVDGRVRRKRVYSEKTGELIVSCGYYMDQA